MNNNIFKKNKKWIKLWSLVFLCFLFGVNTYAWFAYISKVSNKIESKVVEWDVIFQDVDNNSIENISFNIEKMYPGMENQSTTYVARNNSDLDAYLEYKVKKITLFGHEYEIDVDYTYENMESLLTEVFPFKIEMTKSNEIINKKTEINFIITVSWDYEKTNKYYQVNNFYEYLSDMEYLINQGGIYTPVEVTSSNYNSLVENGLYLSSDYADTYWGEMSKIYNNTNKDSSSLVLDLELTVKQV